MSEPFSFKNCRFRNRTRNLSVYNCQLELQLTALVYVTRKAHFNAAHRLHNHEKSVEWNRETFGKCNNPNWHGHNYTIEITVAGTPDPDTGYVIDLGALKKIITEKIVDPCDHKNLNKEVPILSGVIPTTENLAEVFFKELELPVKEAASEGSKLYSVKLFETERNMAEYCPYRSV